ncbi:acyl-coenzyme A thioesterase 13 isoform X6 [Rosa chinensis]|uniref:acyl-coenzyme A thioesterase 13 isoform X6 n=1 Tax=Rosa chinensis TaxID=74649 RepID=UPI000D08C54E|nr:acyl-coenzyme A thioesterase 13 isoform X6 [Rosa chinensis]
MAPIGGEDEDVNMKKKAKESLELSQDESEAVSRIVVPAQRPGESSIYDMFSLRGIRVDRALPGFVVCTLKDRAGNLAQGAIANLVDVVGASVAYIHGLPMNVSVDISVSYMSKAKLDDELEITSQRLGRRGGYSGAIVILRNKATGEVVAEGRHSMFRPAAKL